MPPNFSLPLISACFVSQVWTQRIPLFDLSHFSVLFSSVPVPLAGDQGCKSSDCPELGARIKLELYIFLLHLHKEWVWLLTVSKAFFSPWSSVVSLALYLVFFSSRCFIHIPCINYYNSFFKKWVVRISYFPKSCVVRCCWLNYLKYALTFKIWVVIA